MVIIPINEVLKKVFKYENFRFNQEDIIKSIMQGQDTMAIMATGSGKSVCFQIPALLLNGLTIVVCPLISLMNNQVKELKKIHVKAECINSGIHFEDQKIIFKKIKNEEVKLLYISPEKLENEYFLKVIININVSLIVIDETHCLIWGDDFRKSYYRIPMFVKKLKKRPIMACFSATVTENLQKMIIEKLKLENPKIFISQFDRKNLYYGIYKKNKLTFLNKYLTQNKSKQGIIYCLTIKSTMALYKYLLKMNFQVTYYHGKMDVIEKNNNQKKFFNNQSLIMVATNAFGMGINKPDIRYIINYELPQGLEDLAQMFGRCSRDGQYGECYILYHKKDTETLKYFIEKGINKKDNGLIKRKNRQYEKLIAFCKTRSCLHTALAKYFNEQVPKCFNCSNCQKNKIKKYLNLVQYKHGFLKID